MYKKIMVAVDGSETAQNALEEAQNIANSYNATLCIIHSAKSDSDADMQAGGWVDIGLLDESITWIAVLMDNFPL